MSKKKTTIREAIRVVGHLLETNGTTNVFARNRKGKRISRYSPNACKFCLSGACDVVAVNVLGIDTEDVDKLCDFEDKVAYLVMGGGFGDHIPIWDTADKETRKQIIETLKNA